MGFRLLRKAKNFKNSLFERRDNVLKELPKNSICAEIGVYKGELSQRILNKTKPKKLVLIDAWSIKVMKDNSDVQNSFTQQKFEQIYLDILKNFQKFNNVEVIRKNSIDAMKIFSDSYFDWVYIDASHRYQDVLNDLEISMNKVKSGGIIAGDDYIDVRGKWGDDVIRAVNDFAAKYNLDIKSINDQFMIKLP
mgnify:FL=1